MTMERQMPSTMVSNDIRVVVRLLLLNWFWFIEYWSSKWVHPMAACLPVEISSRRKFLSKNLERQEELAQIFAPFHHLCSMECSCCTPTSFHYDALDGVLYGISPDLLFSQSPFSLKKIFELNALLAGRYFKRFFSGKTDYPSEEGNPQRQRPRCPALTEKGCGLPLGSRPIFCVFFLCGRFLREMNWRAYWRYVWVSYRYLLLLTLSLKLVVAEWRQKQGVVTLTIEAGKA